MGLEIQIKMNIAGSIYIANLAMPFLLFSLLYVQHFTKKVPFLFVFFFPTKV